MPITFNNEYVMTRLWFVTGSRPSEVWTNRGDGSAARTLFPTSAVVGNYICFDMDRINTGKFKGINLNITTALAAAGYTYVWEYARRSSSTNWIQTNLFDWVPLTNVVDGSNGFTTAGVSSVTWDIPTGWSNYFGYAAGNNYYCWLVRIRITGVSSITTAAVTARAYAQDYTLKMSGYTSGSPCTMQQLYDASVSNSWNVVTKVSNFYELNCNLKNEDGSYFSTKQETIQFAQNWDMFMRGTNGTAVVQVGTLLSGDKVYGGSNFIFVVKDGDLGGFFGGDNSYFYNMVVKYIFLMGLDGLYTCHGHWGGQLGARLGHQLIDVYAENMRQYDFTHQSNVIINVSAYNQQVESPGAVIKNVTMFGYQACLQWTSKVNGTHIHQCDLSGATLCALRTYYQDNGAGFYADAVDCFWGNFADSSKANWVISPAPAVPASALSLFETYSLQAKILDSNSVPISSVQACLTNKNNNQIFNVLTTSDGYIAVDSGIITSATTATLTDTSKAWITDQHFYKEVLITSGVGAGQRRIVKKGTTANTLPVAPVFTVAPTAGAKFVIIPYIRAKEFNPVAMTPITSQLSAVTDYNSFVLVLSKYGKIFQRITLSFSQAVVTSFVMPDNPFVIATESQAAAITGVAIAGPGQTITVTQPRTIQEIYDYSQWWRAQAANQQYPEPITTTDGQKYNCAANWSITINGCTVDATGKSVQVSGTGTYAIINGGDFIGTLADITHTRVKIQAPNLVAGTRVQIYNATLAVEVDCSLVSGGAGYTHVADIPTVDLVSGNTVRLRAECCNGVNAKNELEAFGILTTAGLLFIDTQTDWAVYNTIGQDGSTMTEFIADYPNVQVDLSDPDGQTTRQRFVAWWVYNLSTPNGIRYFFGGLKTEDIANYMIDAAIINLQLDNISSTPVRFTDSARLYRSDGATIIAPTSGSIHSDPGKVYALGLEDVLTLDDFLALRN